MSTILGQTVNGARPDSAFNASATPDKAPPAGFDVKVTGLNTSGNNPGTVGVMISVDVPRGYTLNVKSSGSWADPKYGAGYDKMIFTVDQDGGAGGTTGWEVWFSQQDVDSNDWSMPVDLLVGGGTYTYHFKKGGSGGGHHH